MADYLGGSIQPVIESNNHLMKFGGCMTKLILYLNDKMMSLKKSISALKHFICLPYVHTSSSGYDILFGLEKQLTEYNKKLKDVLEYKRCTCNKLVRRFTFNKKKVNSIDGFDIYQCRKCGGHICK